MTYMYMCLIIIDCFPQSCSFPSDPRANAPPPIEAQVRLFCDEQNGGFFSTTLTLPHSVLRLKEGMDGSLPSVNAVTAANLLRLSSLYKDKSYSILAHRTLYAFRTEVPRYPWMFPGILLVPPLRG